MEITGTEQRIMLMERKAERFGLAGFLFYCWCAHADMAWAFKIVMLLSKEPLLIH